MDKKEYYEDGVAYDWDTIKYTTYEFRKVLRDLDKENKSKINKTKENCDEN